MAINKQNPATIAASAKGKRKEYSASAPPIIGPIIFPRLRYELCNPIIDPWDLGSVSFERSVWVSGITKAFEKEKRVSMAI